MKRRSLKSTLFRLNASIVGLIIVVAVNFYLDKISASSANTIHQINEVEKNLSDAFFIEGDLLLQLQLQQQADASTTPAYERIIKQIAFLQLADLGKLLSERQHLFSQAQKMTQESTQLMGKVRNTLLSLVDSTKYIHEHHIVYFKNMTRRGVFIQDYDDDGPFYRSAIHSAPEIEIIEAAVNIQGSLMQLMEIFSNFHDSSRQESNLPLFKNILRKFYISVNNFEDFSLDSQDGLLVEELLLKGRVVEDVFSSLVSLAEQKEVVVSGLATNREHIYKEIMKSSESLEEKNELISQIIFVLHCILVGLILTLIIFVFIYGNRIMGMIDRIVSETNNINDDLSYQIPEDPQHLVEFDPVFQTLNSTAHQANQNIIALQKAHEEMENRVTIRTRELRLANKNLLQEIDDRQKTEEEKEKLQSQLQQTHKMEAIGTLAGGIAHDFNNILTGVLGFAELAKLRLVKGENPTDSIDGIINSGTRAKDLVKQILAFSRQSKQDVTVVELQPIVKETLKLLRATIPSSIAIESDIDDSLDPIMADSTQVHQIIVNLCTNASQSMGKNGILTVTLSHSIGKGEEGGYGKDTEYACLTISDTGHGIDPSIQERIFDPFFTTKEVGEGTGMGLSVVHGIVKSCGGMITVDSTPGKGTTFSVYFPLLGHTDKTAAALEPGAAPLLSGGESILFVDDEESILQLARAALGYYGYHVTTVKDSREALSIFIERPDFFDVVITDQTMPNFTGLELAQNIHQIRPQIPVILCSGYSNLLSEENFDTADIQYFVKKPLTGQNLAIALRETLDKSTES